MKTAWNYIQAGYTAIGASIGYFLGGWDGFLYALLIFVLLDYISGVMCAIVDKKLSSEIGFRGIFKKVLIFALVGVAHVVDQKLIGYAGSPEGGSLIRSAVIFFYIANEGISIIENVAYLGLPIPKKLKDVLLQLKDKSDDGEK